LAVLHVFGATRLYALLLKILFKADRCYGRMEQLGYHEKTIFLWCSLALHGGLWNKMN